MRIARISYIDWRNLSSGNFLKSSHLYGASGLSYGVHTLGPCAPQNLDMAKLSDPPVRAEVSAMRPELYILPLLYSVPGNYRSFKLS
jgi:hypothetical protein